MSSEVICDLHNSITLYLWPQQAYIYDFFMASEVIAASEVMIDLKIELSDLNYICSRVSLASICHYFKKFRRTNGSP